MISHPMDDVGAHRARAARGTARRLMGATMSALLLVAPIVALASAPASADTAPLPPVTVPTVSADALPTAQINGVVWDQVIVGSTVYVTGDFTKARPAGSAAGVNEVNRTNLMAYNLTTGVMTSWAPTLNGVGKTIKASADGTVIYVGGSFTQVNGVTRNRVAAINASTGAVVTTFNPNAASRVNVLDVRGNTVYLAGIFNTVGGQARSRIAAVNATTGAVLPFAPTTDAEVLSMTAPPGNTNVVFGGRFTTVNGVDSYGMASVDGSSGALLPWAILSTVRNAGDASGIYSLTSDSQQVYGTGYTFGGGGNFEGTFAARNSDGAEVYVTGCRGDTYDAAAGAGVLYYVGHPHDCSTIGGHPQTNPTWTFQRAIAETTTAAPSGLVNQGGNFSGQPAPELLHWLPTLETGSYTGKQQAAWDVETNGTYVVLGGEFPSVNGVAQQGLVRFAVSTVAPNKEGPQSGATVLTPNVVSLAPGRVRVSWMASWDRDNRNLSYEVLRGSSVGTSTVLGTVTKDSAWWNRPMVSFQDTTAPVGSTQTYRIRAKDAFGNTLVSNGKQITVPAGNGTTSTYANAVQADGATHLWRLGESAGTTAYDYAGADDLTLDTSATRNVDGAMTNDGTATATRFPGSVQVPAVSPSAAVGPQTFSEELWFRTTTTSGGKLLGYGDSNTGTSSNYDRHVYMTNSGNIVFGVYTNGTHTITSPKPFNDGQWHHVVATLGIGGQSLYLDGKRIGTDAGSTAAQGFTGFWRVGGDNLGGWPDQPSSNSFAGDIEDVSIYDAPLTLTQVQTHFQASGRSLNLPARPTDAYGAAVWDAQPSIYWRLDDAAGATTAINRMTNEADATYSSGVVRAEAGAPANAIGSSIRFPGDSEQTVVSTNAINNPRVYSVETWFKTASTDGGRIIGFGNSNTNSRSGNYDRYIWMTADGKLRYGIYDGNLNVVESPKSYNDGTWHLAVATQGSSGQSLYIDGGLVGSSSAPNPQDYTGYWRLGTDNTWGGANTDNLAGSLDEAAVYDSVLPAATVTQHWNLGKPAAANQAPTAAFTSPTANLKASFDASASTDADGTIASYTWQFGDGTTGSGVSPEHTYPTANTYTAVLTVTDDKGASSTVSHDVTVTRPANQLPTAAFSSSKAKLKATFDASASADPDGTIASYSWDFGDGSTGTGVSPSHTYATAKTYPVALTVIDDRGGAATVSHDVAVAANAAPVAAFGNSCTNLACTFDGRSSNDTDGQIASYSWTFGDGTPAVTTAQAMHTYATGGSKDVTLTVTDDDGTTNAVTKTIAVSAANVSPTAAFTTSCTESSCSFNGTGSADPDGSIASYAWTFGGGATATGSTASHTYAAGSYPVTLTVTDDKGATDALTKTVTVTAPATGLAADTFGRTVASSWGNAQTGGAWTHTGTKTTASVADGSGRVNVPASTTDYERLAGVSNLSTDVTHTVWIESATTGGGAYLGTIVRATPAGDYSAQVKVLATGAVTLGLGRTGATIGSTVTVPGLTYTANTRLRVRVQAVGSAPTTLRAKVWKDGATEPSAWTVSATDGTSGYQVAGSVGVFPYLSGTATAAVVVRYDDFAVTSVN